MIKNQGPMNNSEKSLAFFSNTDYYLKSNPIIQLRKAIVADLLAEFTNKQIIDIGCGNGEITRDFLDRNNVTFLDLSLNMLNLAKEDVSAELISGATFINTDFAHFKTDTRFDIVVCMGVLAHVNNIREFLNKLKEITTEGGIILLQYSASEKLISKINRLRHGLWSKSKYSYDYKINLTNSEQVHRLLNDAGLTIVKKVNYLPVSPLFSVFNYETKVKLLKAFYRKRLLSSFGSEIILYISNISSEKQ